MIRVLQVLGSLQRGGTEAYVMNHYLAFNKTKIKCDFLILNTEYISAYEEDIQKLGGRIITSKKINTYCSSLAYLRELKKIIENNGPYDVVHSHVDIHNYLVMLSSRLARVPLRISHCHGVVPKYSDSIKQRVSSYAKKMINLFSANKYLACSFEAAQSLYGTHKANILPNGIDLQLYANKDSEQCLRLRRDYNIPENVFVIGNITRFDDNKNQLFLLDIFAEIKKIKNDAILVLGGPGEKSYIEMVVSKIKSYDLTDSVRLIGVRDDVRHWMHLMDVYVFPSKHEGFGIVLLEAQAAGLPCITSDTVPKTTDFGLVSFLNLNEPIYKWVHAILSSKKNQEKLQVVKEQITLRGYDISKSAKKLQNIYLDKNFERRKNK